MHFARRQMNATILADGEVLVTHGTSGPGFNDVTSPVLDAELWNPATKSWTILARESVGRTYHSTAMLLPDARVLSSGSGEGQGISFEDSKLSAQIYSPPYLYAADGTLAPRPRISSAPSGHGDGQAHTVEAAAARAVRRGANNRLSSVTHAFNQSQLAYPLTFTATGATTLRAAGPANANLAPPGPYMLFLVNDQGVPSQAKIVTVEPAATLGPERFHREVEIAARLSHPQILMLFDIRATRTASSTTSCRSRAASRCAAAFVLDGS